MKNQTEVLPILDVSKLTAETAYKLRKEFLGLQYCRSPFIVGDVDSPNLTSEENQSVKVLNFIAEHDGVITSEEDIRYLLKRGIENFIHKSRQHLLSISKSTFPIKIIVKKKK